MSDEEKLSELINSASRIVIVQADNPDGDSLGSAIALEQILTALGKDAAMFCAVDIPKHLKYLSGWSRVERELPKEFDLSIIVDTSSASLMEKMSDAELNRIKAKPVVILDHHKTEATIDFATLNINREVVATGELIYDLAIALNWPLNQEAKEMLAISILSDSLGLMSSKTTAHSIKVISELVEGGVNLTHIDGLRRDTLRKSLDLTKYKGELLARIQTYLDNRLAMLVIPWDEIQKFSPLYNPPMLVMEDMRLIEGNAIVIAIKVYGDGHLSGKIRANDGYPIAATLAEHFGGGGHDYAAGFKTTGYSLEDLKKEVISETAKLLSEVKP
jgi:bifunctional oligoribonuclease and PAP phosphatase NrnA